MTWYDKIIRAHVAVTNDVSHFERLNSDRYFVWQEDGQTDLSAENQHAEKSVSGSTDLFTKLEFDPWKSAFERSLTRFGINWSLNSIQYEEDTGFIHYEWVWDVRGTEI